LIVLHQSSNLHINQLSYYSYWTHLILTIYWIEIYIYIYTGTMFFCYFQFDSSFFFGNPGCPGQLTRTTTNPRTHWTPCKPSRQVRHRGGNKYVRWDSNPCDRGKETLPLPLGHKPRCFSIWFLNFYFAQLSYFE